MEKLLLGVNVANKITDELKSICEAREKKPKLAIVQVGSNPSDEAYLRGAISRGEKVGVDIFHCQYNEISTNELVSEIEKLNEDESINGILVFRPLPKDIDDDKIRNAIDKSKDVDGISDLAMAGIYAGDKNVSPPCTAQACMEILEHYGVELSGKNVVVLGRSLVIGKPVAMLLLEKNATVTICHSKSNNLEKKCKEADIIIVAVGRAKFLTKDMVSEGQVIIDVGINVDEDGNLIGDVDFENVEPIVRAITPVPRGVGSVTSSILMKNTISNL